MKFKVLISVALVAAALTGAGGQASAKDGKQGAALLGAAAGVAVGAVGATMYNNSQQQRAPQRAAQPEYTGSTARPVYQQASGECGMRRVKLFDESGNYVKTERMRVCD